MKYLVSFLSLVIMGCAGQQQPLCNVSTPGSNMIVHSYGDSITAGAGTASISIGNQHGLDANFCAGYQARFTLAIGGNGDDQAHSGTTIEYSYARIQAVQSEGPSDINTWLPGFNDVSFYGADSTHLALFQTDLTEGLTKLASFGKLTIVGTTLYMSEAEQAATYPLHTDANTDLYINVIKAVVANLQAQGLPIVLSDTNSSYDPNTMTYPGNFHPSDYGHQILARTFLDTYNTVFSTTLTLKAVTL